MSSNLESCNEIVPADKKQMRDKAINVELIYRK